MQKPWSESCFGVICLYILSLVAAIALANAGICLALATGVESGSDFLIRRALISAGFGLMLTAISCAWARRIRVRARAQPHATERLEQEAIETAPDPGGD